MYPDAILIFLMPPGADELQRRLVGRGTEDAATVRARLARACEEAEGIGNYDYLVVNDEVQACADRIGQIADAERLKVSRQAERIRDMRQGLEKFRA